MAVLDNLYNSIIPASSGLLPWESFQQLPLNEDWDASMDMLSLMGDHKFPKEYRTNIAMLALREKLYPGVRARIPVVSDHTWDNKPSEYAVLWTPPGFNPSEVVISMFTMRKDVNEKNAIDYGVSSKKLSVIWPTVGTWLVKNSITLYVKFFYRVSTTKLPFQWVGYESEYPLFVFDPTEEFNFSKTAKMRFPILRKFKDVDFWQPVEPNFNLKPRYRPRLSPEVTEGFGQLIVDETCPDGYSGAKFGTGTWREKDLQEAVNHLFPGDGQPQSNYEKYGERLWWDLASHLGHYIPTKVRIKCYNRSN